VTLRAWGLLLFWAGPAIVAAGSGLTVWRLRAHLARKDAPRPAIRRMQLLVLAVVAAPWLVAAVIGWTRPGTLTLPDEQLVLALAVTANLDLVLWIVATIVVTVALARRPNA
jgi:hypothetical protein